MSSTVDVELNASIDALLTYFFASLKGGSDSSTTFLRHWATLSDTFESHRDDLKQETLANAHNLASTIDIIASGMLELDRHREDMQHQLTQSFLHILNDDMENLIIRDEFPISTGNSSAPPYIKPCSQWLMANLHSPYPSISVRNSICRQTGYSMKDLDAWFTDARKRIGWNQLRRTYFSNKREKIVDAATSFFKPSRELFKVDPFSQVSLDRSDDHSMAFVEMEERAQRLFSDKFEESSLARMLNHVVQDSSPSSQMRSQISQPELQNQQHSITLKRKRHAYPSPERSPEPLPPSALAIPSPVSLSSVSRKRRRSPSEACPDDIGVDRPQKRLCSVSLSTVSHKRSRSSSEDFLDEIGIDRPQKRFRSISGQNLDSALAAASLPSPAASLNEVSSPAGNDSLPSSKIPSTLPDPPVHVFAPVQSILSTKRKRCFSDSGDQRSSKYPEPASLSRITSNPLPMPIDFLHTSPMEGLQEDCLFNQPFSYAIPYCTPIEIPDDSVPLDISYYQYSLSPTMLNSDIHHEPLQDSAPPLVETTDLQSALNAWAEGMQLHGYNLQSFMSAENSAPALSEEPNYFQFDLPTLSIPTSPILDWMNFVTQPINIPSTSTFETGKDSIDLGSVSMSGYQSAEMGRAAKRERAELLRAELKRLEADIA